MYQLVTNLEHLEEETSMDSISFLPSGFKDVKSALYSLAKEMPEWNIEILEKTTSKEVRFGNSLSITVPTEYWNEFLTIFDNCDVNNNKINISNILVEAIQQDVDDLLKNLKPQLIKTFTENPIDEVQLDLNRWKSRFGVDTFKKQNVLVSYQNKKNDLRKLYNGLIRHYRNDKGDLEMLTDALEGKTSLASFELFNDHAFLYGARIFSRFHGTKLLFEATVDPEFNIAETVYIDDPDVVDVLNEHPQGYKISGNVVYPKGQRFKQSFYRLLEEAI